MPRGPRFDPEQDDAIRNSIENGIWLCEACAALIDKNGGDGYSIEQITKWKYVAEKKARVELEGGFPGFAVPDIQAVSYVNVYRLVGMAARRGVSTEWPLFTTTQWLHDLGFETLRAMNAAEVLLKYLEFEAVALADVENSNMDITGLLVAFNERFFTKNGPKIEDDRSKSYPFDDWPRAPHLYKKCGPRKFVLVYEPRWLTSTTAFVEVNNGRTKFAGLAVVKIGHPDDLAVIASPIVLGWPKPNSDLFEEFSRHIPKP